MPPPTRPAQPGRSQPHGSSAGEQLHPEMPDDVSQPQGGQQPGRRAAGSLSSSKQLWIQLAADVLGGCLGGVIDSLGLSQDDAAEVLALVGDQYGQMPAAPAQPRR